MFYIKLKGKHYLSQNTIVLNENKRNSRGTFLHFCIDKGSLKRFSVSFIHVSMKGSLPKSHDNDFIVPKSRLSTRTFLFKSLFLTPIIREYNN